MNNDQISAIEEAIQIIDEEIKQPLDLDRLSKKVGISKYHLHHLFKSITGKPLMSYARGRRLSMSITDLINTDLNIIDIASEYQFEHEQSYIRAFKQRFNITPSQYRKSQCEMPIEQKIDTNHLRHIGQGLMIEPQMCIRPEFYVQGIQKEIVHEENLMNKVANKLVEEFQTIYLPLIDNRIDCDTYIGLVLYAGNSEYSNYYVPSVVVTPTNKVVPPFVSYKIPMQEYAVFRYIGLHSPFDISYVTLKALYDFIDEWKIGTAYRQAEPFHFEKINLNTCCKSYCEMDIYIPIEVV